MAEDLMSVNTTRCAVASRFAGSGRHKQWTGAEAPMTSGIHAFGHVYWIGGSNRVFNHSTASSISKFKLA